MNKPPPPLLSCNALSKTYRSGGNTQNVLNGVHLNLKRGEVVSIVGASGSGKTTLLHLLGGLDTFDGGSITCNGQDLAQMNEKQLARWRNESLAFVFQFHLLLPEFSALENVAMPLLLRRADKKRALATAAECLDAVNLGAHRHKPPDQLSGGERQRVAVARALAGAPSLILADEPTGNLDRKNADTVFNALIENCRKNDMSLILVSHDERLAAQADRVLTLQDGKLSK